MAKDHNTSLEYERRIQELQDEVISTKKQLLELMEQAAAIKGNQKDTPPSINYNSPDYDHFLNRHMDEATVVKGIVSQVYYGRVVTIHIMGSGAIEIKQQSHHLIMAQTKEKPYVPTRIVLSQETFFLILEAMRFAEDKFGLDRKTVIEKLTGGGAFNFKEAIALL